jgi:hypothetical protein
MSLALPAPPPSAVVSVPARVCGPAACILAHSLSLGTQEGYTFVCFRQVLGYARGSMPHGGLRHDDLQGAAWCFRITDDFLIIEKYESVQISVNEV